MRRISEIELRCPNFYNCKSGPKIKMKLINLNESTEVYQCPKCGITVTIPSAQRLELQMISYYQKEIDKLKKHRDKHYQKHLSLGHIIVATDFTILEQLKTDKWACCGTTCIICGKSFGWFCPKSPNPKEPYCHYKNKDKYGCDDCGMPEERK